MTLKAKEVSIVSDTLEIVVVTYDGSLMLRTRRLLDLPHREGNSRLV